MPETRHQRRVRRLKTAKPITAADFDTILQAKSQQYHGDNIDAFKAHYQTGAELTPGEEHLAFLLGLPATR